MIDDERILPRRREVGDGPADRADGCVLPVIPARRPEVGDGAADRADGYALPAISARKSDAGNWIRFCRR